MKLSEVTLENMKQYARIDDESEDTIIEDIIMPAALDHIYRYTGQSIPALDAYEDMPIAFLALCSFLYDNRSMTTQNDKANRVVESFLDKYSVNLL